MVAVGCVGSAPVIGKHQVGLERERLVCSDRQRIKEILRRSLGDVERLADERHRHGRRCRIAEDNLLDDGRRALRHGVEHGACRGV